MRLRFILVLFVPPVMLLSIPVAGAQPATQLACDVRWSEAERAVSTQQRLSRYRAFIRVCPRDARTTTARKRIAEMDSPAETRPAATHIRKPRPPGVRPPRQPRTPRPPVHSPASLSLVNLDETGRGDATTLHTALNLVRPYGTIRIHRGHYRAVGVVSLTSPVTLAGVAAPHGNRPVIEGQIHVSSHDVRVQNLVLQSQHSETVVRVTRGTLDVVDSEVRHNGAALSVGGRGADLAALRVDDGNVSISRGLIGPGASYAVWIEGGRLTVERARIQNSGRTAIYAVGGETTLNKAYVSGRNGIGASGTASLFVTGTNFTNEPDNWVLYLTGASRVIFRDNVFDCTDPYWLYIEDTVTSNQFVNNRNSCGELLPLPRMSPSRRTERR
jgi:hypothetical protein